MEFFSLDVTAEALRAIIGSKLAILLQLGRVDPKFHVGVAPNNHSSSPKTRLNDLSYDIKKSEVIFLPFCHNSRVRQTDRILIARPRLHFMQRGKNVKRFRDLLTHTKLNNLLAFDTC